MSKIVGLIVQEREQPAKRIEIENNLTSLQGLVGGYIECVTLNSNTVVVCDEEGVLKGKDFNRTIENIPLVGTFLILGVNNRTGNFISLTEKQISKYGLV